MSESILKIDGGSNYILLEPIMKYGTFLNILYLFLISLTCLCHETIPPERLQHRTPCQTETPSGPEGCPQWLSNYPFSPPGWLCETSSRLTGRIRQNTLILPEMKKVFKKVRLRRPHFFIHNPLMPMRTFHVFHHIVIFLPHCPFRGVVLSYFLFLFFNLL